MEKDPKFQATRKKINQTYRTISESIVCIFEKSEPEFQKEVKTIENLRKTTSDLVKSQEVKIQEIRNLLEKDLILHIEEKIHILKKKENTLLEKRKICIKQREKEKTENHLEEIAELTNKIKKHTEKITYLQSCKNH